MDIKKLELPGLELADPNAEYSSESQIFYIDFDGAENVSYDNDALDIHLDGITVSSANLTEDQQSQIITELNDTFAGTGIFFTTEVTENTEYSTIYIGETTSASGEWELLTADFQGLAETIDVGNQIQDDNAFVFIDNLVSTKTITETIAHEAGHLIGMQHTGESGVYTSPNLTEYASSVTTFMLTDYWGHEYALYEDSSRNCYYCDANKDTYDPNDDNLCWAAANANIINWGGWAHAENFINEDYVFDYFLQHWSNGGDNIDTGLYWWLTGEEQSSFIEGIREFFNLNAVIQVDGGGFVNIVPELVLSTESNTANIWEFIKIHLNSGYGINVGFSWDNSGHAITIWGYKDDSLNNEKWVYYSDSDDDGSIKLWAGEITFQDGYYHFLNGKIITASAFKQYDIDLGGIACETISDAREIDVSDGSGYRRGNIDCENDYDYYKFTAPGSGLANIGVTPLTTADTNFYIYNSSQTLLASVTNSNSYQIDVTAGSLYYIRVEEASYQSDLNVADYTYTVDVNITATPEPDLIPYCPNGWDDKIVASIVTGTSSDTSVITEEDDIFIDWAVKNDSNTDIDDSFYYYLYVDDEYRKKWTSSSLSAGSYAPVVDYNIGKLAVGTHTIKIVADSEVDIDESNETNNEYTKTITVQSSGTSDPDTATVSISVQDSIAGEPDDDGMFRIYRYGGDINSPLTVTFSWSGDAIKNNDYGLKKGSESLSNTIVIDAGEYYVDMILDVYGSNNTPEPTESVIITIEDGEDYNLGTPSSQTIYITDDDGVDGPDSYEDDDIASNANEINISGITQTHNIHDEGDVDWLFFDIYQKSQVTILTSGDPEDDDSDTEIYLYGPNSYTNQIVTDDDDGNYYFSKITPADYTNGYLEPGRYYIKVEEHGLNKLIQEYDIQVTAVPISPTVSISVQDSTAGEPDDDGIYRITRDGGALDSELVVYFATGGDADKDDDYILKNGDITLSTSVTIAAGESYVDITLDVQSDNSYNEEPELATLTLISDSSYEIDSDNASASISITEDNQAPSVPAGLIYVANGETTALGWKDSTDSSGIKEYIVEFADNAQFTDSIIETVTASEFEVTGLTDMTTYYWRVKAIDNVGNESSWAEDSFLYYNQYLTKLTASDGEAYDNFGLSVDLDESYIVVGAPSDDSLGDNSGSVYVYNWNEGEYEEIVLYAQDGEPLDFFGSSVAIEGNYIVVGASGDDINGNASGIVYVYHYNGVSYDIINLVASEGVSNDFFGESVSIDGSNIVVGGHYVANDGTDSICAYVYRWNGTSFDEFKLITSDRSSGGYWGSSVAIDGDNVVVGAAGDDINGSMSGSIYLYHWNGSFYDKTKLAPLDDGTEYDYFGASVAIDEDNIVVGAPGDDINGDMSGIVYVYRWNGSMYDEIRLCASDGAGGDYFGCSVAIDGDYIAVGAWGKDENGSDSGCAYVFHWNGSSYDEFKLLAPDGTYGDQFGYSVAIQGDKFVVNSLCDDDSATDSGSAYVFDLSGLFLDTPVSLSDTSSQSNATLDWNDVSDNIFGINHYVVEYADNFNFTGASSRETTFSELDINGLDDGIYYWHVKAVDNEGNESAWSVTDNFTIDIPDTEDPDIPTGLTDTVTGSSASLDWSDSTDESGIKEYIVQYADNENFTSATSVTASISEYDTPGLSDGTYYWRVKAVDNSDNESIWSTTDNFTIDTTAPTLPSSLTESVNGDDVTLDWNDSGDATTWVDHYNVEYTTAADFNGASSLTVTASTLDLPDLADGVYHWQVQAVDANGNESNWIAGNDFTVDTTAPDIPTGLTGIVTDASAALNWSDSSDNITGTKEYIVQYADNDGFVNAQTANSGISELDLSGLANGIYYWRVKAIDNNDNVSDWSITDSFNISTNEVIVLSAQNGSIGDEFGGAVDIDGDRIVVGAAMADNPGSNSGSVYAYHWNGSGYDQYSLDMTGIEENDLCGCSVAISGDTILVGATGDDDKGSSAGSVYIFTWNGSSYDRVKILALDGDSTDRFGVSVAIDGDILVSGACYDEANGHESGSVYVWSTADNSAEYKLPFYGAEGDLFGRTVAVDNNNIVVGAIWNDQNGKDAGKAYVYRWNSIEYEKYDLLPSEVTNYDNLGYAVAIDSDVVVVGAFHDDNVNGTDSGSVYVYHWDGQSYQEMDTLLASNGSSYDYFGCSVAVEDSYIAVGAYGDDTNGDEAGMVYLYRWNGRVYDEVAIISNDSVGAGDSFGRSVAIDGDNLVISAIGDDVNGNNSGRVYVYSISDILIDVPPTIPVNLMSNLSNSNASLDWDESIDEAGVKEYIVEYADNDQFTESTSHNVTASEIYLPELTDMTTYYWRVKAIDNNDNVSDWSITDSFSIDIPDTEAPYIPTGLTDGVTENSATLDWEDSNDNKSGLKEYVVQYADNENFENAQIANANESLLNLPDLTNGTYYWRVKAIDNNNNESEWSGLSSFEVNMPFTPVVSAGMAVSSETVASGTQTVIDGGLTTSNTIDALGIQNVSSGGVASATIVNSGGKQYVYSNGTANSTEINTGGTQTVMEDGMVNSTMVNSSGYMHVSSGGTANSTTVNSRGNMYVSSGGEANSTILSGFFACLSVSSGGSANSTTIDDYGYMYIYNGGTASNTVVNNYGYMKISSGGIADNTIVNSSYVFVDSSGTVNNTQIHSGGSVFVNKDGTVDNTMINSGGYLYISSGAYAANTTIESGGIMRFYYGSASGIIQSQGGIFQGCTNATVIEATNENGTFSIIDGTASNIIGGCAVLSGHSAVNTTVTGSMYVFSGGSASGITQLQGGIFQGNTGATVLDAINENGAFFINNGIASNIIGGLEVKSGHIAYDTTVASGADMYVCSGGSAVGMVINSGGSAYIESGGIISGSLEVNGGRVVINENLRIDDPVDYISLNGDSILTVRGGLYLSDCANLYLSGECNEILTGGAGVIVADASEIVFDLTDFSGPNNEVMLNNLSIITADNFTVTVGDVAYGDYRLAGNADAFNQSITVEYNDTVLGNLDLTNMLVSEDTRYLLSVNSSDELILTVTVNESIAPDIPFSLSESVIGYFSNLNWSSEADDGSGVKQYIVEYANNSNFNDSVLQAVSDNALDIKILPDTEYYWRVKAVDYAGNESAWSATESFTTRSNDWNGPVVDSLLDVVDDSDGITTLREAIILANSRDGYDAITFADGLTGTIYLNGSLDINDDVDIIGLGADLLTLDANGTESVFEINGSEDRNIEVMLSGLMITGASSYYSGGIEAEYSNLTVSDCIISGNDSGGINFSYGSLFVSSSIISDNRNNDYGGGIYVFNGSLTVLDSVISTNTADYGGGGINVTVEDGCVLETTIINSEISDNNAISEEEEDGGGGIRFRGTGDVTVINCTIAGNYTGGKGGGVKYDNDFDFDDFDNNYSGILTINNSIVADNSANINYDNIYGVIGTSNNSIIGSNDGYPIFIDSENGDYRLSNGSTAINAGNNHWANNIDGTLLMNDLNGNDRISDSIVDIGAYESDFTTRLIIENSMQTVIPEGGSSSLSLRLAEAPEDDVVVSIVRQSGSGEITISDSTLTFSSDNWNIAQELTFSAPADADFEWEQASFMVTIDDVEQASFSVTVEDPVTYVVDSLLDVVAEDGVLTLREAILAANTDAAINEAQAGSSSHVDKITFAEGLVGTINLNSSLEINSFLDIIGPGADSLSINYDGSGSVFSISNWDDRVDVSFAGVTISGASNYSHGIQCENCNVFVSDCIISDNEGGGIEIYDGNLFVTGSIISENGMNNEGGGITANNVIITVLNSVISNNNAEKGAGIYIGSEANSTLNVINSEISGNTAVDEGGGIWFMSNGYLLVTNSTIAGNIAGSSGGGISFLENTDNCAYIDSILSLNNSVIAGNISRIDIDDDIQGFIGENNSSFIGTEDGDPLFLDSDNGDYRLSSDSSLINAGNNELAVGIDGETLSVDLDGNQRFSGDFIDIGAYETDVVPPVVPTLLSSTIENIFEVTFDWADSTDESGISGYVFQLSEHDDFSYKSRDVFIVESGYNLDWDDGIYYWRVKAIDNNENESGWSDVSTIVIDSHDPEIPSGLADNVLDDSIRLSWEQSDDYISGIKEYIIEYADNGDFDNATLIHYTDNVIEIPPLGDGIYYWRVKAVDNAGNESAWSTTETFSIDLADTTAPSIPTGLTDSINNNDVSLDWSDSTDDKSGIKEYIVQYADNLSFSASTLKNASTSNADLNSLNDGTYYWRVKAVDNSDNESSWSTTDNFTIDTTAPTLPSGLAESVNGDDVTLDWNDSGDATTWVDHYNVEYTTAADFNGASSLTVTASTLDLPDLADGVYHWQVQAVDANGNESNWIAGNDFTVDTTAPGIDMQFDDETKILSWSITDDGTGIAGYDLSLTLNGDLIDSFTQLTGSFDLSESDPGDYELIGWAVDGVELRSEQTLSFTINDNEAPTTPGNLDLTVEAGGVDFSWTEAGDNVEVAGYNISVWNGVDYDESFFTTDLIYSLSVLPDGTYSWKISAEDTSENTSDEVTGFDFIIDTTAPDVPNNLSQNITEDSASLNWDDCADNVTGVKEYVIEFAENSLFTDSTSQTIQTSEVVLSDLTDMTTYFWRVKSVDNNDNESAWSVTSSFDIDIPDTKAPAIPESLATTIVEHTATLDWADASDNKSGIKQYIVEYADNVDFNNSETLIANSSTKVLEGLTDLQTYYWRVMAEDAAGNLSEWSEIKNFTIDVTDTQAPDIPTGLSGLVNDNSVSLDWGDSSDDKSGLKEYIVEYSDNDGFLNAQTANSGVSELDLSGLFNGIYYWRVQAIDNSDNASAWSSSESFTVDMTAPDAPASLNYAVSGNDVSLDWIDSVDSLTGLDNYIVEYTLTDFDDANSSTPDVSALDLFDLADGVYSWRVKAVDSKGNETAWVNGEDFTIDTTAPAVPADLAQEVADDSALLNWSDAIDNLSGMKEYIVEYADNDQFIDATSEVVAVSELSLSDLQDLTTYFWHVKAVDNNGNESAWSAPENFSIDIPDTEAPQVPSGLTDDVDEDSAVLDWNDSSDNKSGIKEYVVEYADNDTFAGATARNVQDSEITLNGLLDLTTYYWRVKAVDTDNNTSTWSSTESFRVDISDNQPPTVPTGLTCAVNSNDVSLNWSECADNKSGVKEYMVEYSIDGGFVSVLSVVSPTSDIELTDLSDGTYYWRVKSVDECGNSSVWSAEDTFYIDVTAPDIPDALTCDVSGSDVTFDWTDSNDNLTGLKEYDFEYSPSEDFSWSTTYTSEDSSYPLLDLTDGIFYWRVRSVDENNNKSAWAYGNEFTVDTTAPGTPTGLDNFVSDRDATVAWNTVVDNLSGIKEYVVEYADNAEFDGAQSVTSSNVDLVLSSLPDGSYFWHVKSLDNSGNESNWSSINTFNIDQTAPDIPDGLSSSVTNDSVALDWANADDNLTGIKEYIVEYVDISDLSSVETLHVTSSELNLTGLSDLTTYQWRVKTVDNAENESDWSTPETFTVDIPDTQSPSYPTGLVVAVDGKDVTFDWADSTDNKSGIKEYVIEYDKYGDSSGWFSYTTTTSEYLASSMPSGRYSWRVKAVDNNGNVSYSSSKSFVLDTAGDGFSNASTIDVTTNYSDDEYVGKYDACDMYCFDVDSPGEFDLALTNLSAKTKVALYVWNGKKYKKLKGANAKLDKKTGLTEAHIDNILLDDTTYYLEVMSGDKGKGKCNTDYTLDITPSYFPEATDNNSWQQATEIIPDVSLDGFVGFGDACDWYKFQVDDLTAFGFDLTGEDKNARLTVYIWDERKDKLKKVKNAKLKFGEASIDNLNLDAGLYYVEVLSADKGKGKKNTDYNLSISEVM